MFIVFIIYTMLGSTGCVDGQIQWNSLRVTWGPPGIPGRFDKMPLTVLETHNANFTKLPGSCEEGNFVGHRYIKGNDTGIILLYDVNGYIAGVQTAIPVAELRKVNTSYSYFSAPEFQSSIINGVEVLVLTTYIVNPSKICNGGRTQEEFNLGTATGLWIQNGSDPITDSFMVPKKEDDIGTTKWSKGGCLPTMGDHYWYNIRTRMNCNEHFPYFILYNKNQLVAYGFANIGKFEFTTRYEHPSRQVIEFFLQQDVPCYKEEFDRASGFSTFHIYLVDDPSILTC